MPGWPDVSNWWSLYRLGLGSQGGQCGCCTAPAEATVLSLWPASLSHRSEKFEAVLALPSLPPSLPALEGGGGGGGPGLAPRVQYRGEDAHQVGGCSGHRLSLRETGTLQLTDNIHTKHPKYYLHTNTIRFSLPGEIFELLMMSQQCMLFPDQIAIVWTTEKEQDFKTI